MADTKALHLFFIKIDVFWERIKLSKAVFVGSDPIPFSSMLLCFWLIEQIQMKVEKPGLSFTNEKC